MTSDSGSVHGRFLTTVLERPFAILAGIAATLFFALVLILNEDRWYALLYDDAFFYIKTASLLAQGKGFTFDGVNPTNGFHPLYMLLLTAISWIHPLSGVTGIITIVALDLVLWVVFIAVLLRFTALLGFSRYMQALVVFAALPLTAINDFGLESRLFLPIVFATLAALANGFRGFLPGVLLAGMFLTRIDSLLLIVVVLVLVVEWDRRQQGTIGPWRAIGLTWPLAVAAVGYVSVNLALFGHPTSISSWLKFGWPGTLATGWLMTTSPGFKLRMLVCSVVALVFIVQWLRRNPDVKAATPPDSLAPRLLLGLNVFTLVYFAILIFFARSGIYGWYFALPMTTLSISFLWQIRRWEAGWGRSVKIAFLAICLLATGADLARRLRSPDPELPAMAAMLRQQIPVDARILMIDVSGKMGYASERAIVNGDGLINGWEYQEMLRDGRLVEYLRKHRIDWLLWHWYYDQEKPLVLIPLWHGPCEWRTVTFAEPIKPTLRSGRFALFSLASGALVVE